jgi:BRCA1-associated protein
MHYLWKEPGSTRVRLVYDASASSSSSSSTSSSTSLQCMVLGLPREYAEEDFRLFIEPYLHAVTSLLLFDARTADLRSRGGGGGVDVDDDWGARSSCRVAVVCFADAEALAGFAGVYNNLHFPGFRDVAPCVVAPVGGVLEEPALPAGLVELPACAVCLRRLQCSASGLDPVGHTPVSMHFAGNAARCLACRVYADRRESRGGPAIHPQHQELLYRCVACGLLENVWLCLVCAYTGCGRYTMRHAEQHFGESQHAFSLELATGRVWDYQRDTFVHFDGDAVAAGRRSSFGGGQQEPAPDAKGPAGGDVAKHPRRGAASFSVDDGDVTRGYMDLTAASTAAWDVGADAEGLRGKLDSLAGEYERLLEGQLRDQQLHFQKILARETVLAIEESIALQRRQHATSSASASASASAPPPLPLDPAAVAALDAQLAAVEAAKVEVSLLEQDHAAVLAALALAEKEARQARKGNDALVRAQQALRERVAALEAQAAADKAHNDLQVAELQSQVRDLTFFARTAAQVAASPLKAELEGGSVVIGPGAGASAGLPPPPSSSPPPKGKRK